MHLSVKTVGTYRSRIIDKTGLANGGDGALLFRARAAGSGAEGVRGGVAGEAGGRADLRSPPALAARRCGAATLGGGRRGAATQTRRCAPSDTSPVSPRRPPPGAPEVGDRSPTPPPAGCGGPPPGARARCCRCSPYSMIGGPPTPHRRGAAGGGARTRNMDGVRSPSGTAIMRIVIVEDSPPAGQPGPALPPIPSLACSAAQPARTRPSR